MHEQHRRIRIAALLSMLVLVTACASPSARFDRFAASKQLQKVIVPGVGFEHALFRSTTSIDPTKPLHVYLGGDGSPWSSNWPSSDPTPSNPLALRLMVLDSAQTLYVGRPCYHGLSEATGCRPNFWTSARYSSAVVNSISAVISNFAEAQQVEEIVLIGYSGGGTIAALATEKIDSVATLVTVAANLDTQAWTQHHNYDPLIESLNPAQQVPAASDIRQIHLVGENDRNVPPTIGERFFQVNEASRSSYPGFDHQCCWEDIWRDFSDTLSEQ